MRAVSLLLAGGMLLLGVAAPAPAATIREGAEAVLGGVETEGAALGTLMFYDPGADLAGGEGGQPYGPGDRAWAESCLAIYDLYRQLGGEKPDGRLRFRRDGERYFIAVAGAPGRWFESREAALADLLRLLLARSGAVPDSLGAAARAVPADASLAMLSAALDKALASANGPVILSPGEIGTLTFEAADIAVGTEGLTVTTEATEDGGVTARVSPNSSAAASRQSVFGFRDGRRFRPVAEREVSVREGASRETVSNDTPPEAAAQPLQDGMSGTIRASGETLRYTVPVTEGGSLSVSSIGPSDVEAVLRAADGSIVARNDDSGGGYNFALDADLEPGTYTLEVRHCCAGTGPFSLTVKQN